MPQAPASGADFIRWEPVGSAMTQDTKPSTERLAGDAAWQAARREVSKRNEVAFARGREQRAARDAAIHAERRVADRRELEALKQRAERFG
jgi:hypothetical protein